jgi:hypothetical protein
MKQLSAPGWGHSVLREGQLNCVFQIGEVLFPPDGAGIIMLFNSISGPLEDLHIWSATSKRLLIRDQL